MERKPKIRANPSPASLGKTKARRLCTVHDSRGYEAQERARGNPKYQQPANITVTVNVRHRGAIGSFSPKSFLLPLSNRLTVPPGELFSLWQQLYGPDWEPLGGIIN